MAEPRTPREIVDNIMREHRGCCGSILFIHKCQASGLSGTEIKEAFESARLKTAVAAGVRYVHRPNFAMSAYTAYLEGRSWNSYYRRKDLERLT